MKSKGKDEGVAMDYTPLTYPCPKCGSNSVAQDPVCAQVGKPLMLDFFCCDCHHQWKHPYEAPKSEIKDKEDTMQATYNGFTGELYKLERAYECMGCIFYNLSIYDSDKKVTHSFTSVKMEDLKFSGGEVSFK